MKARYLLLLASFTCISASYSIGQFNCVVNPATPTREPLVCLVPFSIVEFNPSSNQAIATAAASASLPVNGSIAAQLTQLPVPSGASGTITLRQEGNPQGRTFNDLEPVLTERPETIGGRHLYAGFTYQHFNFNALDGIPLSGIKFGFASTNSPNPLSFYGSNTSNVSFKLDQSVVLLTFGATKTTDISVVVPFNSVTVSQTPSQIQSYVYNSLSTCYTVTTMNGPNTYCPGYTALPVSKAETISGSDSGVGDVKFGVKQMLYGQGGPKGDGGPNLAVSAGLNIRIPTGNALNFLGSGAYGVDIYGLVSYRSFKSPFSPHFKIGKLWNGPSPLLNPNGSSSVRLPGGMEFGAGADYTKAIRGKRVTVSVDVIGNQFTNAPSLSTSPLNLNPPAPSTITFAQLSNETYTAVNFSGGVKFNPTRTLLIYGNVLVPLNNVGLRSDPVPLGGISWNFDLKKKEAPQP